jgi:RimJ/RimL family protein N-acetyltransferase
MLGPILPGEKISLAPATREDIPLFCAWFANLEVTRYLIMRFPPSEEMEEEWLKRTAESQSVVYWVMKAEGRTVGSSALHDVDWTNRHATSGTVIGDPADWGKGYATEATRLRTAFAFDELGLERLESESFADNTGMHRVLQRAGYREIGRRHHARFAGGRWHDTVIFELLREEWLQRRER